MKYYYYLERMYLYVSLCVYNCVDNTNSLFAFLGLF